MYKESYMGFVPCNFDPEYSVDKIKSSTVKSRINSTPIPLFCTTPIIFQNVNNPSKILFWFSSQNICVKNIVVREFCSSWAILESVLLLNVTWYRHKEIRIDHVMLNIMQFCN